MRPETALDNKAFNEIYTSCSNKIYNFVLKIVGDRMVAEDITQDTFMQVYDKYATFRGDSSVQTWIYSIAKNNCFKYLNKARRGSFQEIENLIDRAGEFRGDAQYSDYEKRIYVEQVKEGCLLGLLRCLSYNQRISFILNIINDVSVEMISKILKKTPNAVRILIHRARSNVKAFLCRNCSLYDRRNACKCENLISFSLDQGWISKEDAGVYPETIENELHEFGDEILLYRTLRDHDSPMRIAEKIKDFIKQKDFQIFLNKKVK